MVASAKDAAVMIRDFADGDAGAVNRVALSAFAQYEGVYSDWETLRTGVGSMAALSHHAEIVVADAATSGVVGAVAYCPPHSQPRADFFDPDRAIIRMLVVNPASRGHGIGRALTMECVRRAKRDGAPSISLHTSPAMEVALAMYLKIGFRLVRPVPDRFGVPYAVYTLGI